MYARSVLGLTRVIATEISQKSGVKFRATSAVVPWIVRHSSWLLNRFQGHRRQRGQTSFQLQRGEEYQSQIFKFGDVVTGMHPYALGQPKLQARFTQGIWLGKLSETEDHIVGTPGGILMA